MFLVWDFCDFANRQLSFIWPIRSLLAPESSEPMVYSLEKKNTTPQSLDLIVVADEYGFLQPESKW